MLELEDIQGNILAGFNTNYQVLVGLAYKEGSDWQSIARWLADRSLDVTTVTEVKSQRDSMKAPDSNNLTWLCLAVSERLMTNTQSDVIFSDDAFRRGMIRRAGPVLGDRTSPDNWKVGGTNSVVDVLLIVGSNNRSAAESRAEQLIQSALIAGFVESYLRETAERIEDLEHFGFRDGISQPSIIDYESNGELGAGHFVYGYPKMSGLSPVMVRDDPWEITKNGSLLVLRRLQQHVDQFRAFCDSEAERLQAQWPGLTSAHLQALMVGRWQHGALVSISQPQDLGPSPDDNNFDFSDDMDGLKCPFGAHIRKVNPRKGPKDFVEVPRLLRRGIPFGPRFEEAPEAERGLVFISFQTSIVETFERLTAKWMNVPEKPAPAAGHDMLVGRSPSTRSFTIKSPYGPVEVTDDGKQWITPTGGAYLFAPSRSGLAKFGSRP